MYLLMLSLIQLKSHSKYEKFVSMATKLKSQIYFVYYKFENITSVFALCLFAAF